MIIALAGLGLVGTLARKSYAATFASVALLGLVVWGRISSDTFGLASRVDTALLLLQFLLVILLMEASTTLVSFDSSLSRLEGKEDEVSARGRDQLNKWVTAKLTSLGKLLVASFGLSLVLLIVGGLLSVSFNELVFNALLALAAIIVILFLIIYEREPPDKK